MLGSKNTQINAVEGANVINISGNNNYIGPSMSDIIDICNSLIESEISKFQKIVRVEVDKRIKQFSSEFYIKLINNEGHLDWNRFSKPEYHQAIYLAQKGFVFGEGDNVHKSLLVDLLISKLDLSLSELNQIILSQAIKKIAILTNKEIELIGLLYLIYEFAPQINVVEEIISYYQEKIDVLKTINVSGMDINHIVYTSCMTERKTSITPFEYILKRALDFQQVTCYRPMEELIENDQRLKDISIYWNSHRFSRLDFTSVGYAIAITQCRAKGLDLEYDL